MMPTSAEFFDMATRVKENVDCELKRKIVVQEPDRVLDIFFTSFFTGTLPASFCQVDRQKCSGLEAFTVGDAEGATSDRYRRSRHRLVAAHRAARN